MIKRLYSVTTDWWHVTDVFRNQIHLDKRVNEMCENSLLQSTFMCHTMSDWYSCFPRYWAPVWNTRRLYLWKQFEICPSDHIRFTWWSLYCFLTLHSRIFLSGSGTRISGLNSENCTKHIRPLVFLSVSRDFQSNGAWIIAARLYMAVVNGGYFHYTNMNKFLENHLLWKY